MTDKEIKKALECCSTNGRTCEECPYDGQTTDEIFCDEKLQADALDIINHYNAEIERLKEDNDALNNAIDSALDIVNGNYQIGRSAGIKELAEKLKKHFYYNSAIQHIIDNFAKEVEGGK